MGDMRSVLWLFGGDLHQIARTHGQWMVWNLVLAAVPVALAVALFRAGRRHGAGWWLGTVLFVLFLPNAPYVLTDVVHLFDDVRSARSDLQLLGAYLPVYAAFFAVGFGSYVACLDAARGHARDHGLGRRWPILETALHALCAVGIYLGRVVRLNSWTVFTRPQSVLGSIEHVTGPVPLVVVAVTAGVLASGTMVTRPILRAAAAAGSRGLAAGVARLVPRPHHLHP
jgi:uncharacterized membrane protein